MESKKIILKGERNAILTLRGENSNVRWELQPNVKIGAVALFDRQGRMYSAEDRLLQMNLEDICAAAILENGRILAKGDTDGDFPWVRLQAEIMMKQKITGKSKETASVPKEPIRQNIIEQQVETTARQEQGPVVDTKSWEQEIEPVTRAYDAAEQQANEAAEWTELEDKANEVIEYATEPENQEEPAGEFLEKTQEPTDVFESGFEDKQISFQADNPIEIEADEREESTPFFAGQTDPNFVASVANDSHEQTWEERSIEESQSPAKHCPMEPIVTRVCPFPDEFPESQWRKIQYKGMNSHYLLGDIFSKGNLVATAFAVPASYSPVMPPWIDKRSRYYMSRNGEGGYWVLLTGR